MEIVTLTMNPTIDQSASVERVLPDRKLRCKPPAFEPGGGGINVSRAVQRLNGESLAIYPAGGSTGKFLKEMLDSHELHHQPVPVAGRTRQHLMIYEESTGQQFRFGMPGPQLEESEWRHCLKAIFEARSTPAYVVASGSLPAGAPSDLFARMADLCKERGSNLIVDTSGEPLEEAVNAGVFLIKPNLRELKNLANEEMDDEYRQESFVQSLVENGRCRYVVVSLGAGGVLTACEKGCQRFRAPTVTIRSKVGAGDSMVAGITLALSRGEPFVNAVRYGLAAGSAAVMTPGSELCRREDVERLYQKEV